MADTLTFAQRLRLVAKLPGTTMMIGSADAAHIARQIDAMEKTVAQIPALIEKVEELTSRAARAERALRIADRLILSGAILIALLWLLA